MSEQEVQYSTEHPHGPENPDWIDEEGRCLRCGRDYWESEAARLLAALVSLTEERKQAGDALRRIAGFARELEDRHTGFRHIRRMAYAALRSLGDTPEKAEDIGGNTVARRETERTEP